jgi:hypothetical protein
MIAPHSTLCRPIAFPAVYRQSAQKRPVLHRSFYHSIRRAFQVPQVRKAILAKAIAYFGPETDYLPRRQRVPEGGKSSRRLRLYWRSVDKEITRNDRPHHRRPKHFNKRISVLQSKALW